MILTLILLEPRVISLCHQYRSRPDCASMQSDQAVYCWLINCNAIFLISQKIIIEKVDYSMKEIQQGNG